MSKYHGDYVAGSTVRIPFNTTRFSSGAPYTLAGTPTASVRKDGGSSSPSGGVTLTVDRNSVTGQHEVVITTGTDPTFFSVGSDFDVVLTAGTVDSVSVVGAVVGSFSIENRNRRSDLRTWKGSTPNDLSGGKVDAQATGATLDAAERVKLHATQPDYAPATNADMATLLGRLTAARAGYLDNLNVGGAVASQADVLAINQSASRRVILQTVGQYERPEAGSTDYWIEALTYDPDGTLVNADSTPTLTPTGITSGDLSANLSVATNVSTGRYRWTYTVQNSAATEAIRFDFSAVIGGSAQTLPLHTQVADFVAATFSTQDRADIQAAKASAAAIEAKLPSKTYLAGSNNADGDVQLDEATGVSMTLLATNASDAVDAANMAATSASTASTYAQAAQVSAASADSRAGTIVAKLAGITLLASWLKKIMRSDFADATAETEIGGTYDKATDSLQAIRDRGDMAWVTGGGAGGGSGTTTAFDGDAATQIDRIEASIERFQTGPAFVTNPVSASGRIFLRIGTDRTTAVGDSLKIREKTAGDWSDDLLAANAFRLLAANDKLAGEYLALDATKLAADGNGKRGFSVEVAAATLESLHAGGWSYAIVGDFTGPPATRHEICRGPMILEERLAAAA